MLRAAIADAASVAPTENAACDGGDDAIEPEGEEEEPVDEDMVEDMCFRGLVEPKPFIENMVSDQN